MKNRVSAEEGEAMLGAVQRDGGRQWQLCERGWEHGNGNGNGNGKWEGAVRIGRTSWS